MDIFGITRASIYQSPVESVFWYRRAPTVYFRAKQLSRNADGCRELFSDYSVVVKSENCRKSVHVVSPAHPIFPKSYTILLRHTMIIIRKKRRDRFVTDSNVVRTSKNLFNEFRFTARVQNVRENMSIAFAKSAFRSDGDYFGES